MNIKVKTALRAILIGATVIPLVIIGLVASINIFGFSSDMLRSETITVGAAQSAGVQNIVSAYLEDVKSMGKLDFVAGSVTDLNSNKEDVRALKTICDERSGGKILDVVVTNKDGMVVFDTIGSSAATTFFAFDGTAWGAKQDAFASKIYLGEPTYGKDLFVVTSPSGEGYFSLVIDLSAVTDCLKDTAFLTHGRVVVADADSVLNYNGAVSALIDSTDFANKVSPLVSDMVASTVDSKTGNVLNSCSYLGSYGHVPGTDWVWVSLYPASEASSSVFPIFAISMGVIAVLAIICVLVMILVVKKVLDPMIDMLSTMKEINSGDHDRRIETRGMNREFARMSDTFNNMMDDALLSAELHKTISDLSDNMLFEWDFAKEAMFISDNFKEKIGLDVSGATLNNGKFIDSMMNADDAEKYKRDINQLFKTKDDVGNEYQIKNAQGQDMWVSMRAHCITDRLGEILRVIGVLTDINSEKNASLKLAERASYDFLSQLYNRNTFEREFQAELDRNMNAKVAALFIDVDDFKFINDRYSHAVGDEVIKFVADVIKSKAGETGFAGRFGGDEFVLCISDPNLIENVEVLSMDIIDDLYSGYYSATVDTTLNIKASIGIALYPDHGKDGRELVGCSDAAMYFVKKNGKANYHIYDPSDSEGTEGNHSYSL
ncbi:MAG: diguanylate cyclase [Ruminiclostridium sp.]